MNQMNQLLIKSTNYVRSRFLGISFQKSLSLKFAMSERKNVPNRGDVFTQGVLSMKKLVDHHLLPASTLQSAVVSAVAHSATSTLQSTAASAVAHSAATSDEAPSRSLKS